MNLGLFPLLQKSFKNLKIALKKGEYVLLYISEGFKDLADKKTFYLPDLSGEDMSQAALLSGGTIPGKPYKELNFEELCGSFPQVRECDVLWFDNAGLKLAKAKDIVILDTNTDLDNEHYTQVFHIVLLKESYIMNL